MKFKRIISTALALVMALGVLAVIPHEAEAATVTPLSAGKVDEKGKPLINYTGKGSSDVFETREAKLATMMKIKEESGVIIYYEAYTGEVAFENTETGDILFTNPYDVSGPYFSESEATKKQLFGGAISGLGGLYFVMDYTAGAWTNNGFGDRGWLAVAIVIFALWKPASAILSSFLFGGLYIICVYIPGLSGATKELIKMLPYLVTIIVLVLTSARKRREHQPPAHLGMSYFREDR